MSDFSQKGVLRKVELLLLKCLLVLSFAVFVIGEVQLSRHILEALPSSPFIPANPNLPLPVTLPSDPREHRTPFSPSDSAPPMLAPSKSQDYRSLTTSGHTSSDLLLLSKLSMQKIINAAPNSGVMSPPHSNSGAFPFDSTQPSLSPDVSDCCKAGTVPRRGSQVCHCVYPVRIELLLMNASLSSALLEELASQLGLQVSQFEINNFYIVGLSGLNITMDITPLTGISFTASDVYAINSSLAWHKVHFNTTLIGDYRLLNLTWFEPPPPSLAPSLSVSPIPAPRHLPSMHPSSTTDNSGKHSSLVLILGIGSGTLAMAIICIIVICKCQSDQGPVKAPAIETVKQRTIDAISAGGSLPLLTSTRFLAYEELKEATKDFEPASMVGEGGFGRVFKGVLRDGTPVAIKKLTSGGHQGDKEFLVEVEMLSRLHHRNLVKLVGYYRSRDSSQNLLCYELVSNGSLEAWLHGPMGANCPLEWDTRMKIALDAARGLAYLHEDSQPCIIHRDFKASNILLENDFHAKVADFGLAKQAPEGRANYLSTRVMGTFGYVAPEYAMTGHLLVKSDVYSYGVVLLELLTGRKPVDMTQPSGEENLVTWARPILRDKDRLEEVADPRLAGKYPKDDFVRVCTIAAACVSPEANQRPTMGEVVQSLKMVQRVMEHQDSVLTTSTQPNIRQSSTTYESDGTSSMFSSSRFSGLSAFDNENVSKTALFSEDLHEGR